MMAHKIIIEAYEIIMMACEIIVGTYKIIGTHKIMMIVYETIKNGKKSCF